MNNKKKKLLFVITFSIIIVLLATLLFWSSIKIPFWLDDWTHTYRDNDADIMLAYIGEAYTITFPDNIDNLKAAKTPKQWIDEGSYFILKFDAKPEIMNNFLLSLPCYPEYQTYSTYSDFRLTESTPDWCKEVINEGKIAKVDMKRSAPISDFMDSSIYIILDTTDKERYAIYIKGPYKGNN